MAEFLLILPILLFSVVAHEYAHAWTAYRQGDNTAYLLGRLTFNPIPHIDPFMSIIVPVGLFFLSKGTFTFGAAKPVPVNPKNYRHYRRGDVIVSSAGIVMNLLIALASAGIFIVLGLIGRSMPDAEWLITLQQMASIGISLNILLALFNLVPLPPLDGSHLVYHLLPPAAGARYQAFGRYGFALLMLAIWIVPSAQTVLLWPVARITEVARTALIPWTLAAIP
ncbi:MAG TPA: site-2 protease family protein [Gemmatimonadales bacterium]